MKPFSLRVNGVEHLINQEKFKNSLVDIPKDVILKQLELGYAVTAVVNSYNNVLVPIAVDVHKYLAVRTKTKSWKVAEVSVLLGKKEKDVDLFVVKETTAEDLRKAIDEALAKDVEIQELKAQLKEAQEAAELYAPGPGTHDEVKDEMPIEEQKEDEVAELEVPVFEYDPADLEDPVHDDNLTKTLLDEFKTESGKVITRGGLQDMVSAVDPELDPKWLAKLNKETIFNLYNELCDEQELEADVPEEGDDEDYELDVLGFIVGD